MTISLSVEEAKDWPSGNVGYVALIGRPNVGKSTLLNKVLKFHLAAVSHKPQTTRRNCLGVLSNDNSQILFLDAPGVHVSKHELDEAMDRSVNQALADADVILVLADASREPGEEDRLVASRAKASGKPILLAINKVDSAKRSGIDAIRSAYVEILGEVPEYQISALNGRKTKTLLNAIRTALPEGPFLFPPDTLTDVAERQIASELVREVLLEILRQEVPHAMSVTVDGWKDLANSVKLAITLHVERDGQKGIVIGKDGETLKQIRAEAIKRIAELTGKNVDLKIFVRTTTNWRKRKDIVKEFGFDIEE